MATHVTIDGSMLEGGGQILRMSSALSAITGTGITVENIRAGRSKPGLAAQHMTGLQLVRDLSHGSLQGATLRSSAVTLNPVYLKCGQYLADIKTAGACSLLIQSALPCLLYASPSSQDGELQSQTSQLTLKGGTDAAMAPPINYVTLVLVPQLRRLLGADLDLQVDVVQRGFYPRGGGTVHVTARCLPAERTLPSFELTQPGHVVAVRVHAFTAGRLPQSLAQRMADAAVSGMRRVVRQHGRGALPPEAPAAPITSHVTYETPNTAHGDGGGMSIVVETSSGCLLGANVLVERDVPAEALAERCVSELEEDLAAGACVDQWMQDQLIIFMALASGTSRMRCREPSLHCRTAMVVAESLTTAKFKVVRPTHEGGTWLVECVGAGISRGAA